MWKVFPQGFVTTLFLTPQGLSCGAVDLNSAWVTFGGGFHLMGCDKLLTNKKVLGKGSSADNPSISPRQQLKCLAVGNIKQGGKCQNSAKNSKRVTYWCKNVFESFFFFFLLIQICQLLLASTVMLHDPTMQHAWGVINAFWEIKGQNQNMRNLWKGHGIFLSTKAFILSRKSSAMPHFDKTSCFLPVLVIPSFLAWMCHLPSLFPRDPLPATALPCSASSSGLCLFPF